MTTTVDIAERVDVVLTEMLRRAGLRVDAIEVEPRLDVVHGWTVTVVIGPDALAVFKSACS